MEATSLRVMGSSARKPETQISQAVRLSTAFAVQTGTFSETDTFAESVISKKLFSITAASAAVMMRSGSKTMRPLLPALPWTTPHMSAAETANATETNTPPVPGAAQENGLRLKRTEENALPAAQRESGLRLPAAENAPPVPKTAQATENNAQNGQQNAQNPEKTLTGMDRLNAARAAMEGQQGRNSKTATVVEHLRKNAETLLRGAPVATIDGNEIPKSGRATDRVMAFLSMNRQ